MKFGRKLNLGGTSSCQNDEETVPLPSKLSDISVGEVAKDIYDSSEDYLEGFVNMISVDVASYAREHFTKSVRKNLAIPAWLNDAARRRNINFSKTLQEALLAKVQAK